jgi:glycosyltransferase involved in cell wall biosynthesis
MPFFEQADLFICPLRIGGGIKVKILEALYAGMAIVTTSIGAQGLGSAIEQAACVCDDPQEFADQVVEVISNPDLRRRLQNQALELVKTLPTWNEATSRLASCYQELADGRGTEVCGIEAGGRQPTLSMEH